MSLPQLQYEADLVEMRSREADFDVTIGLWGAEQQTGSFWNLAAGQREERSEKPAHQYRSIS